MSTVVKNMNQEDINTLLKRFSFEKTGLPPGMTARTKVQGHTISIYQSKKVMIQGKDAETLGADLLGDLPNKPAVSTVTSTLDYDHFNCIGSDEAGSGDYFGPLTVCAAYVSKEHALILKELGVMDSKKLNDATICQLAENIITFLPHSLLVLDNVKYNERKAAGWSQVKMKAVLHNQAIINVLNKIDEETLDYIVIDQFAVEPVYNRYILTPPTLPMKTKFETKGESKSIAIAAASIISRYAFVKHMDAIEKDLTMDVYKGASAKVDLQAAKIIQRYGVNRLDNITKKDFKNRAKALNLVERKRS